jgi:hypothetical protein
MLFGEYTVTLMSDTEVQLQVFSSVYIKSEASESWAEVWKNGRSLPRIEELLTILGHEMVSYNVDFVENSLEIAFGNKLSIKVAGNDDQYECFTLQGLNRYLVI